jgi:hypothetical protein
MTWSARARERPSSPIVHPGLVPQRELPPFKLVPQPLTPEAQDLLVGPPGIWDELGQRHQLGGQPDLHNSAWPSCSACGIRMTFYAQLDGLPCPSEFDLADAGLIYVYVCFDCFEVTAELGSS